MDYMYVWYVTACNRRRRIQYTTLWNWCSAFREQWATLPSALITRGNPHEQTKDLSWLGFEPRMFSQFSWCMVMFGCFFICSLNRHVRRAFVFRNGVSVCQLSLKSEAEHSHKISPGENTSGANITFSGLVFQNLVQDEPQFECLCVFVSQCRVIKVCLDLKP